MRLLLTGEDVYFDEFPKNSKPNQKVFLSHLFNVNVFRLPHLDITPDIYTSITLGTQLKVLLRYNSKLDLKKLQHQLHEIPLRKPTLVDLSDETQLKIIIVGSDDNYSPHVMFILQKGDNLPHLYVGISPIIRKNLLKKIIAQNFVHRVENIYIDLNRGAEVYDKKGLPELLNKIDDILENYCNDGMKIQIIIPMLGYEFLISFLCKELHTVFIDGILRDFNVKESNCAVEFADLAKIHIKSRDVSFSEIKAYYDSKKYVTVKIVDKAPTTNGVNENGYCELYWSPFPNPMKLKKLKGIVQPKNIIPIVHKNMVPPQVPKYLLDMCSPSIVYEHPKPQLCEKTANRVVDAFTVQKDNLRYLEEEETDDSQEFLY